MILDDLTDMPRRLSGLTEEARSDPGADAATVVEMMSFIQSDLSPMIADAKHFYLDQATAILCGGASMRAKPPGVRMPFPLSALSMMVPRDDGPGSRRLALVFRQREEEEDGSAGDVYMVRDADLEGFGRIQIFEPSVFFIYKGNLEVMAGGKAGTWFDRQTVNFIEHVANGFLWLLLRPERHFNIPSDLKRLNAKRQQKGLPALIEFNEIRFDKNAPPEEPHLDGSQAYTPRRQHDVRGYWSERAKKWVKAYKRGDPSVGIIVSRYVAGDTPGDDWKGGPLPAPKKLRPPS